MNEDGKKGTLESKMLLEFAKRRLAEGKSDGTPPRKAPPAPPRVRSCKALDVLDEMETTEHSQLIHEALVLLLRKEIDALCERIRDMSNRVIELSHHYQRNGADNPRRHRFDVFNPDSGEISVGSPGPKEMLDKLGLVILREFDSNGFVIYENPTSNRLCGRFMGEPKAVPLDEDITPSNDAQPFDPIDPLDGEGNELVSLPTSNTLFREADRKMNSEFMKRLAETKVPETPQEGADGSADKAKDPPKPVRRRKTRAKKAAK